MRNTPDAYPARLVILAVLALGCSSVITQLTLMRELLGAFAGNEMVLGITLGLWLLLMGLGTWCGRWADRLRNPAPALSLTLTALAIVPLAQVFLLRTLRHVVFIRGAELGVLQTTSATGVLLLPYCLPAGFALALACALLKHTDPVHGIGRVYATDSVGSILGGLLFSFVLVGRLDHVALLAWPAWINLLAAASLAIACRHRWLTAGVVGVALALGSATTFLDLDDLSTAGQFPGQRVVQRVNSPYGRLVVTEAAGQLNFFENGLLVTSTQDRQRVEEMVHFALAQRPDARRVLLVSGGLSGTALEILKYGVTSVDYVELDPRILELGKQFLPERLSDPRIHVLNTDGRLYVRHASRSPAKYDVVLVDTPAPSTAQLNRYYTTEFFAEIKRVLAKDGVLGCSLGNYENFISPELAGLLASGRRSLQASFSQVLLLPGSRVFFLASDAPLTADIAPRLEAARIPTDWVRRPYLDAMFTADRREDLNRAASQPAALNRDFNPALYFYHLRHWLSQFNTRFGFVPVVLLICLAFYVVRLRAQAFALFASGFAASALELVLLLVFQILCGSIYHQLGILFTLFMAGLALGAAFQIRFTKPTPPLDYISCLTHNKSAVPLARLSLVLALLAAALPLAFPLLAALASLSASLLFVKLGVGLLTFLLALLVGSQFPLACQVDPAAANTASNLYTADFVGASLGAILTGALLIPTLGFSGVCLAAASLNLAAGAVVWRTVER